MKVKKKPPKTAAQRAKEAADKQAETLRVCIADLRKVGKASQFHFVCKIKKATGCDMKTAERHFEGEVREGKIKEAGTNAAGDVAFYEAL